MARLLRCPFCDFKTNRPDALENHLEKKHLDMIVANNLRVDGAGFGGDTNVVTIITKDGEVSLGKMSKEETATQILDQIMKIRAAGKERVPGETKL